MEFDDYQEKAALTDQFADKKADSALMIPLLGIAGETGTLLSEFKKKIRDRESYDGFKERAQEELGDVLWYLSNLATHLGLSLSEIAVKNLHKTQERWPLESDRGETIEYLDADFPETEQLPREIDVRIAEVDPTKEARMWILPGEEPLGDHLTDNAYEDDGYRFHDVFHLAHLAVLGWSPVIRRFLKRKRKSNPTIDMVEDGARAAIMEELIVAYVFANARERRYYADITHLDTEMLSAIKRLLANFEVRQRKMKDWERAILQGYEVFRYLLDKRKAVVRIDMKRRHLKIVS
jgi:NTP pyrophosphatase (non-canonical NTP hydrolase)